MELPVSLIKDIKRRACAAQTLQPVPSPCRNVCRMDAASGYCEGCLRTIDEIAAWSAMAEDDKRRIWAQLPQRAAWLAG